MKISEYIKCLSAIANECGDLEVQKYNGNFDRVEAPEPAIAFAKLLTGRQSKTDFHNISNPENTKGEMVVRI